MTTFPSEFFGETVQTPDVTGEWNSAPVITGTDKAGKLWRVTLDPAIRGLWRTEVDGVKTYYFAGYTGGAGMAPSTWILGLSFDYEGRPVPFFW